MKVSERTIDKNEGGRNNFFFRAATGCRMTEHKQNGNNKRNGDNTYQYNNTNNWKKQNCSISTKWSVEDVRNFHQSNETVLIPAT